MKELWVSMNIDETGVVHGDIEYSVKIPNFMFNELADSEPQFKTEYDVNNKKVNWIDAKNFYGANTDFNKKNIKKQSKKYVEQLGNGCIIFKYGFSSKLNFKDIVLVNL